MKPLLWIAAAGLLAASASPVLASERLCDTRYEDCRAPLLKMIAAEPPSGGIDVAFWFLTDDRYRAALSAARQRGVRVRVLVDPRAVQSKPGFATELDLLKTSGIAMRMKTQRTWGDILHWKLMHFEAQQTVEFSAANYTPDSFVPYVPYQNYIDEVTFTTDDPRLVQSLRDTFEDFWLDTSGAFVDYFNMTSQSFDVRARYYPVAASDPALNFPPGQDYATRAIADYRREVAAGAGAGAKIDVIMYRMSDGRHADEMIRAFNAGVRVRLITEEENYRDSRYIWHSYNADRMWAAGIDVKDHVGGKLGIVHQKSVVLYALKEVIFGGSNWSTASSTQQTEHNIFTKPCTPGQVTWCDTNSWFFNYFVAQFESKWNNVNPSGFVEFKPLVPHPGGTPVNSSPANGAGGLGTTVTLQWDGGNWNHKYDVYLGTDPNNVQKIATDLMVGSPYTGRIESWTINQTLAPGTTYYWRVVGKTMASGARAAAAGLNLDKPGPIWSFSTAGVATDSTPYSPAPAAPGVIEAEHFDNGGQGIAYADTTSGNNGTVYRSTDVDIASGGSASNGYYVGWTRPGEWLKYTTTVQTTGTYTLQVRFGQVAAGAKFHVEVDGVNKTGSLSIPNTGSYTAFQDVTYPGLGLTAGKRLVRVVFDAVGSNGGVGTFDALTFTLDTPTVPTPYNGVAAPLPGRVEAENFDNGGQGNAYTDTSSGNSGGKYRTTDVDIAATTDAGGGFNIGYTRAGEWLSYTVNVTTAGAYTLNLRIAHQGTGASFHVEIDGTNVSGAMALPDTGGWQVWQTVTAPQKVQLSPGTHAVRLVMDTATAANSAVGNYNWFEFVP